MGTDTVTHGFDLFFTDLKDRYFVNIGSERGFKLLSNVKIRDVKAKDKKDYLNIRKTFEKKSARPMNVQNLPNLLDLEFESKVWKKWGDKCLSCGSCSMVCPTCYCYGVKEKTTMNFEKADKIKNLYSCNITDFAMVAGGHNFRPDRETRLKYRYYHQHRGFMESFGEPMCVGCNRCADVCLSGIAPIKVIKDLQMEE